MVTDKKILPILLFIMSYLLSTVSMCQTVTSNNSKPFAPKYYLLKGEVIHVDSTLIYNPEDIRVNIIAVKDDSITFNVSRYNSKETLSLMPKDLDKVPYLSLANGRSAHLKFSDWDASLLAVPIKMRPAIHDNPLEFVGEVTLGSYIGYQWGKQSFSTNNSYTLSQTLCAFAAPSMVKIDPTQANTDMSNTTIGFSSGFGYLVNLNNVRIGLIAGMDYISGTISESWIYQGKPWFSFSIGTDFNDEEK